MLRDTLKRLSPQGLRNRVRPYAYLANRTATGFSQKVGRAGRLPDFLVLGAQKAGTTTLYDLLCQHPDIEASRAKELAYFDRYNARGLSWYAANFPEKARCTGEATPDYLIDPRACVRIANALPKAKFIVLLRNPVDRAISHYFHAKRLGYEPLSLEDAIARESDRTGRCASFLAGNPIEQRSFFHAYSYLARGDYASQLETWFKAVGRSRMHIALSDRFFDEPDAVCREVFSFLGLHQDAPLHARACNVGQYTSNVEPQLYAQIEDHFRPRNRQLAALLGQPVPWPQ